MSSILVGIDIGGTKMAAAAVTPEGRIASRAQTSTLAHPSYDSFTAVLGELVRQVLTSGDAHRAALVGIGIGCTGPLDPTRGTVDNPYTLPIPAGSDIVSPLRGEFGVPVVLENDADAAALGEHWLGAGMGRELMVCITIGTGVGGGVIRGGRIVRGSGGVHAEIGHQVVDPSGPECYCGAHGCWEALASGTAIGKAGQEAACGQSGAALLALAGGQPEAISSEMVFQAARAGDGEAGRIVARAVQATATALFNVVHLVGPDAIILGGGVMGHFDLFEPALRATLARCILMPVPGGVQLAPARLGADAGLLGAARAAALAVGARAS